MKYNQAIAALEVAAHVCENNAPINDNTGNKVQADLERTNAANYREAIRALSQ